MGRRAQKPVEKDVEPAGMLPLLDLIGLALIAARWFTPTEGASRGDTLWISQLWLGWGAVASWSALRRGERWARCTGLWTWGLLLLVSGHVLSGLAVVATVGQKRAALNGLWEWVALGIAAIWFHQRASSPDFRRTFRLALIAAAVGLSGLGIWQRWVTYPTLREAVIEFDRLEESLPDLEGRQRREAQSRLRQLNETIGPDYRMLDADGRRAMRQRLLDSSEPLGRFALANSLAAVLMVSLVLVTGEVIRSWQVRGLAGEPVQARRRRLVALIAIGLFIGFVFLLTKSRTAWVGGVAGGAVAAVMAGRGGLKGALAWGLPAAGVAGVLVAIAWAAGGLDRQVVTEASKSLAYRMEYWTGGAQVIQDHPWLGVGPGNFRQHYLTHKLARSSEEVLDPHNFLIEAWATGGLPAIAGLVAILCACLLAVRRPITASKEPATVIGWRSSAPAIVLFAGVLLACKQLLLIDGELACVIGAAILSACVLNRVVSIDAPEGVSPAEISTIAAGFALSIHLLGAGGMEMPAIIQLWLCVSSLIVAPRFGSDGAVAWPAFAPAATAAGCGLAFFVQLATATTPSIKSRSLIELAQADSIAGVRTERIDERLAEAAVADPFDPEPWRLRAQLAFSEWSRTRDAEWFGDAIRFQQEAIQRDPHHAHDFRALADLYWKRFRTDRQLSDPEAAIGAIRGALERYPHHLASRRLLADILEAAGRRDEARAAARSALELDTLWQTLGHHDKTLSAADRERMESLAGVP